MNPLQELLQRVLGSRRLWVGVINVVVLFLMDGAEVAEELAEAVRNVLLLVLAGYVGQDVAASYRSGTK